MKWMEKVDPDLRRLYRYFLPHKWRLAVAVVFLMGSASMSSVTATLLGKMTDIGFYHQEGWNIYAAPLALIGDSGVCHLYGDEYGSNGQGQPGRAGQTAHAVI